MKYKYNNKHLLNIISFILFSVAYYLYFISLQRCFLGIDLCGRDFHWIIKKVKQICFSVIISSILFILIIFNIISKLHIIHFIIVFLLFYQNSHGVSFDDHGFLNFIGFFSLFTIFILIWLIIKRLISLINYFYKTHKFTKLSFIFLLSFLYYNITDPMNCNDWGKGLNNTFIENDITKFGCQIYFPKHCPYKFLHYFQDFTKFYNINCSIPLKNNKNIIFDNSKSPYINNNSIKIGFPLTNKNIFGRLDGKDDSILKSYVLENLFDVENNTNNISDNELTLDFSKTELGEYIIDLKYNESLSRERKLLENKISPYSNNIMILFIDSVSRSNSIRQLKKTLSFFEKFIQYNGGYNPQYPKERFHSFQFLKYHSFRFQTSGNFPRLFYGNKYEDKNLVLLTKYFKENGYITNYNSDSCQKDNTRTFHNLTESEVYDHQLLLCDPNMVGYTSPYKKCLHGKLNIEHLLNYSSQFWRKYRDNRKFSLLLSNDGHEGSLEALKYIDHHIFNYLMSLFEDNLFKDSTVILMSDHGVIMPSFYSLTDFFNKEWRLPMLYLLINDRKNVSYNEQYFYLQKNQQTFITAYDIYNTINNILYGDSYINIINKTDFFDSPKSPLGQSLFGYINQKERKSRNYESMDYSVCI